MYLFLFVEFHSQNSRNRRKQWLRRWKRKRKWNWDRNEDWKRRRKIYINKNHFPHNNVLIRWKVLLFSYTENVLNDVNFSSRISNTKHQPETEKNESPSTFTPFFSSLWFYKYIHLLILALLSFLFFLVGFNFILLNFYCRIMYFCSHLQISFSSLSFSFCVVNKQIIRIISFYFLNWNERTNKKIKWDFCQ